MQYTAKIVKSGDGSQYEVEFPDVPGCFTYGDTLQDALVYAKEALELMLEGVLDDEMVLPECTVAPDESNGLYSVEVGSRLAVAIEIHEAKKGLKSASVAKRMDMSPQSFARILRPSSNVSVSMLERYAKAVGKRLVVKFV